MKWAQALQVLAGPGQGDVVAHNLGDVDPSLDLIDNVVGNQTLAHESHNSYSSVWHDRTSRLINCRIN